MEAAKKHHAVTWETLNEVYIPEWVTNAHVKEGKKEIPLKSYPLGKEDKSALGISLPKRRYAHHSMIVSPSILSSRPMTTHGDLGT